MRSSSFSLDLHLPDKLGSTYVTLDAQAACVSITIVKPSNNLQKVQREALPESGLL